MLEDALDGLLFTTEYWGKAGLDDLAEEAADLYQWVRERASEEGR